MTLGTNRLLLTALLCTALAWLGYAVWRPSLKEGGREPSPTNVVGFPGSAIVAASPVESHQLANHLAVKRSSAGDFSGRFDAGASSATQISVSSGISSRASTSELRPATADQEERLPDPQVMQRIIDAESFLESLFGDLSAPLEPEVREKIVQDTAYREWMLDLETKLGSGLDHQSAQEMQARHAKTLDLRNKLREAYLSGTLDWTAYLDGLNSVSLWSDEPYQRLLTEDEYHRLNEFGKADFALMAEAVWEPPEQLEAMNLFPQIRANNPDISEQDLTALLSPTELAHLTGLRKSQLLEETRLMDELNNGALEHERFLTLVRRNEEYLAREARAFLSTESYRLFFPDEPDGGDQGGEDTVRD